MKKFGQSFTVSLIVDGQHEECEIAHITPKTVILSVNGKIVYILHKYFNFAISHPEINWHISECQDKDGNRSYFLV